ncbi:MAG: CarD family transcriptional regulator [Spirochaetaceae bacterium]|jgi:CarD family transcriptional regulator|nr:CarD family transcriptional regulator [Spirochaetaceae bacterium]
MCTVNDALKELPFYVGQKVVYPSQGVGVIQAIEEKEFKSVRDFYYIIYLETSDMIIKMPCSRALSLGIRPIVDAEQGEKALDIIGELFEPIPSDWKARYQMNLDLLKKGSIENIALIVRSLYHRSQIKELPVLERRLYDSALKLLEDELSYAFQKPKHEIEDLIFARLARTIELANKELAEDPDILIDSDFIT